ncbi:MAG TPA: DUF3597 domain-containing protein [Rhodopila sp.]|nr:DUF3597 domain-containing protein [Rhodopila sp.]
MSIFGSIMSKIFQIGTTSAAATTQAATATPAADAPAAAAASAATAPAQPVDVEAVLIQMASQKGGGGNWQTSIVDLLKLLDLDSSLNARKELGNELDVHAGADGSAEQNIALHKAVMQKLAENGGKVPDSLRG